MAQLKLNLDADTFQRLIQAAVSERRPVNLQAEVVLRRSMGLPFPFPDPQVPDQQPAASAADTLPAQRRL